MSRSIIILTLGVSLFSPAWGWPQQGPKLASLGTCKLVEGGSIKECRVAYRTFGRINSTRSNIVLIPTWLQGRSEDWLPFLGGSRGYVDTTQFHVIVVDALADGHSSSPSNAPEGARAAFRRLTLSDMVESQYRLLTEHLQIARLHAVLGFSMGGMQALEWAARYPTFLKLAVPIGGAPKIGAFDHLLWTTTLQEIENGQRSGVSADSIWAQLARLEALFLQTPTRVNQVSWDSVTRAAAATSRVYRTTWSLDDFAAQLHAIRRHDISRQFGGDMVRAARAIRARVFLVHTPDDHMVTATPVMDFAGLLRAQTLLLPSECGHALFFCQQDTIAAAVRAFLADEAQALSRFAGSPQTVVQRQFEAYNRHDAEAFAAAYAPNAVVGTLDDTSATRGRATLQKQAAEWFQKAPQVKATLLDRMVYGNFVVDHERVTGLPNGKAVEALGIYEIRDGAIERVWWTP